MELSLTETCVPLLSCLPEHRQRLPVVHRPGVSAQPDPGPQEDALPPLLAQPGHRVALSARPAADVSPQVSPRAPASPPTLWIGWRFSAGGLMKEEKCETRRDEYGISLAAVNNKTMRSVMNSCCFDGQQRWRPVCVRQRSSPPAPCFWGFERRKPAANTHQGALVVFHIDHFRVTGPLIHHHQDFPSPAQKHLN